MNSKLDFKSMTKTVLHLALLAPLALLQGCSQPGLTPSNTAEAISAESQKNEGGDQTQDIQAVVINPEDEDVVVIDPIVEADDHSYECVLETDIEDGRVSFGIIDSTGGWRNTVVDVVCTNRNKCSQIVVAGRKAQEAQFSEDCVSKKAGYRSYTDQEINQNLQQNRVMWTTGPGKLVM